MTGPLFAHPLAPPGKGVWVNGVLTSPGWVGPGHAAPGWVSADGER